MNIAGAITNNVAPVLISSSITTTSTLSIPLKPFYLVNSGITVTLPLTTAVATGTFVMIYNQNASATTIHTSGSDLFQANASTSVPLAASTRLSFWNGGSGFWYYF